MKPSLVRGVCGLLPKQNNVYPIIALRSHLYPIKPLASPITALNSFENVNCSINNRSFHSYNRNQLHFTTRLDASRQAPRIQTTRVSIFTVLFQKLKNGSVFLFTSGLVLGAMALAVYVLYLAFCEIFLPSGDTQIFNKTVNLIENDPECQKIFGSTKLKAYGETTDNKWTRTRPISKRRFIDNDGKEHLFMRFHIESEKKIGIVQFEMKRNEIDEFAYTYLYVEYNDIERYYLVKPKIQNIKKIQKKNVGFLGVKWGPKKD